MLVVLIVGAIVLLGSLMLASLFRSIGAAAGWPHLGWLGLLFVSANTCIFAGLSLFASSPLPLAPGLPGAWQHWSGMILAVSGVALLLIWVSWYMLLQLLYPLDHSAWISRRPIRRGRIVLIALPVATAAGFITASAMIATYGPLIAVGSGSTVAVLAAPIGYVVFDHIVRHLTREQ